MSPSRVRRASVVSLSMAFVLFACGGESSAPPPQAPPSPPVAQTIPDASAPEPIADAAPAMPSVSVVRFDDLGVSFAVPPGFRVLGDDALSARIRATANPHLTSALRTQAAQKKGFPMLSLQKETTESNRNLTVTISVTVVPTDATASELLAQQRKVLAKNFYALTITDGPKDHPTDGVSGTELSVRYSTTRCMSEADCDQRAVPVLASVMRLYVRSGLAFMAVAAWNDGSGNEDEGRRMLDTLHFYEPAP